MADTLPPDLRESAQAAHIALTCISTHPTLDMSDYLRGRVDAAAAGLEAALAAVPAQPVAALMRSRFLRTRAAIAHDMKDHFSEWGGWIPTTYEHAKAVTDPSRNTDPLLYEMQPLYAAPQAVPVPAVPVASVTECEACFTPDACQLRGKCDHYAAEQLRVAKRPDQLVQWGDWTLVPVDPTEAMLKAGLDECEPLGSLIDWDEGFGRDEMRDTYRAMLAAAPKEQPHE